MVAERFGKRHDHVLRDIENLITQNWGAKKLFYDRLWKLLIDKKMNQAELKEASGISSNVLARMVKTNRFLLKVLKKYVYIKV